jgi:hypothetical protein
MNTNLFCLKDIVQCGNNLEAKHNFMLNYVNASVLQITENTLKIKLFDKFPDIIFFIQDLVTINTVLLGDLFKLNGEILCIDSLDPVIFTVQVKKIVKQPSLRESKRYFVNLACDLKLDCDSKSVFVIVKNVSDKGFKLFSNKDLAKIGVKLNLTITFNKHSKLTCDVTVIRKNANKSYFELGTEIINITDENKILLANFVDIVQSD